MDIDIMLPITGFSREAAIAADADGYDTMWINVELVEVPTYFAVGPNVGAFAGRSYINLWDSYAGIQHKA